MRERIRQSWAGVKYRRLQRRLAGPKLVEAFADAHPDPFFVEVGANDGEHLDHLHGVIRARGWRGIMVEPVPYVFERLERNYRDVAGVALENAAIADRDGELPFFAMAQASAADRASLPDWYDQLGSFSRETILSHATTIPDIEARIVETTVPALTFDSLLAKHGAPSVDLLVVDTEGYDYELLRSIDLARHRPRLVVYEHFHLSAADRGACREMVHAAGYSTLEEGMDTFCVDTAPRDALTERFERARPALRGLSRHGAEPPQSGVSGT